MIISSSYSATKIYKFPAIHFVMKHFLFAFISLCLMNFMSKNEKHLKKIGLYFWILNSILLLCVILFGHSAKGAKRWIYIFGFNFQPSEFIKIGVIIQSSRYIHKNLYVYSLTYLIPLALILLQPDLGTALLLVCLACAQLVIRHNKLNIRLMILSIICIFSLIFLAYFLFPHVNERINLFFNSGKEDIYGIGYQKHKAFLTITSGGFFGKGFGKGEVKDFLPDAHTDYIFAVIGEEFGALGCLFIVFLFVLLGLRCRKLTAKNDFFAMIQYSTILLILGQAWLNIASTLSLIPSKGITIPLVSYGGSGLTAQGLVFGLLLAVSVRKSKIKN